MNIELAKRLDIVLNKNNQRDYLWGKAEIKTYKNELIILIELKYIEATTGDNFDFIFPLGSTEKGLKFSLSTGFEQEVLDRQLDRLHKNYGIWSVWIAVGAGIIALAAFIVSIIALGKP